MSKRAELIAKVRKGWPDFVADNPPERRSDVAVPPVRDGGLTALMIDYAVDTVLAELEISK